MAAGYQNLYTVEYASVENKRQMLYDSNSLQNGQICWSNLHLRPSLYNYGTVKLTGNGSRYPIRSIPWIRTYLAEVKKSNTSLSLYADYAYDSRNSKSYPLMGTILRGFVNKIGLGILSKDVDYFLYGIDFHFYQKLSRKWYVAEMFKLENAAGENHPIITS